MQIDLVVLIVPDRAAAVAHIAGDGDGAVGSGLFSVDALHQLGVAGGAAPVLLNTGARFAQLLGFGCSLGACILGHGDSSVQGRQASLPALRG